MASILFVAKERVSNCLSNQVFLASLGLLSDLLMALAELFKLMLDTLHLFYTFSPLLAYSIFLPARQVFHGGKIWRKYSEPFLIISLSAFLNSLPFFRRLKSASMAMSAGCFFTVISEISLSV
jgi:hypothetical protein